MKKGSNNKSKKASKMLLVICLVSLGLFMLMFYEVQTNGWAMRIDDAINKGAASIQSPFMTGVMKVVTYLGEYIVFGLLCLTVLGILAYNKRWKDAILSVVVLVGMFVLRYSTKTIVQRPRPANMLILETGFSFVSGHAIALTVLALLVIYLFKDDIKNKSKRILFLVLVALVAILVCFSRVYLGVHYFSDVLGGISLGVFWVSLVLLVKRMIVLK